MYIIAEGKVNVLLKRKGEDILLATLEKGNFFGEMSLLRGDLRSATVEALTDLKLIEITKRDLEKLYKKNPKLLSKIALSLCAELCRRVSRTSNSLESYHHINRALLHNPKFKNFLQKIWKKKEV